MSENPDMASSGPVIELGDAELARRITAAGDGEAPAEEAELCRRYGNRLLYFGRHRLGSDDDARDLAQDALLLTLEKLRNGQVREPERIGAFILGVARNLSRSYLSGRSRLRPMDELPEEPPAPEIPPPDPLVRARVVTCVEALS
ncbi:MAG: sigma factor, partial [Thermoanaerobaculia bacterium]|nr:sigma factor [Thermoanaerobaculia bacterium]